MPTHEVYVEVEKETDKAILVNDGEDTYWIPKSQIDEESEVHHEGDEGLLVIPEWLAEDKGMI